MATDWTSWGHLSKRYQTAQPRRMLALDGGGIRGILTLQLLVELEDQITERYGKQSGSPVRLCQFFDYIGGTSTGAIIAAALALGKTAREVLEFYEEFGREAFTKRPWYERYKSLYGDDALRRKLQSVYGENTDLTPGELKTLLLVVTRNATTDSPWPISSNPAARYNDATRSDCNLRIPLWQLVRASTAAPVYFPPEVLNWDPNDANKSFVFVDGGTTPYNNPAFLMYRMATEPKYALEWESGEDKLLVVSLGTGGRPALGADALDPEGNLATSAVNTLSALMNAAQFDQDMACRTIGRCSHGPVLDREVGDLVVRDSSGDIVPLATNLGRRFVYTRYDATLTFDGLTELGLESVIDAEKVASLDAVESMADLATVGKKAATKIDLDHFGPFADPARSPLANVR